MIVYVALQRFILYNISIGLNENLIFHSCDFIFSFLKSVPVIQGGGEDKADNSDVDNQRKDRKTVKKAAKKKKKEKYKMKKLLKKLKDMEKKMKSKKRRRNSSSSNSDGSDSNSNSYDSSSDSNISSASSSRSRSRDKKRRMKINKILATPASTGLSLAAEQTTSDRKPATDVRTPTAVGGPSPNVQNEHEANYSNPGAIPKSVPYFFFVCYSYRFVLVL